MREKVYQRSSPPPIRVAIADDHVLFREGVHALLDEETGIEVVAELEDGRAVPQEVLRTGADVLLLDLQLPYVDGYQVLEQLNVAGWPARPIVLTAIRDPELLSRALDLGARGLVAKKGATRNMMEAIRAVHAGLRWVDPTLKIRGRCPRPRDRAASNKRPADSRPWPSNWSRLTTREREVAELVAGGHRYREVARRLSISEHTLKNHLRHIFDKLEIRSRVQLALSGVERRA
jgi:DNA-binding NarL/FixJ family response regulator